MAQLCRRRRSCPEGGCGTVFKIDPTGTETVLYSFVGDITTGIPIFSPNRGRDGKSLWHYGGGGTRGRGTVFKLGAGTYTEKVMFNFCAGNVSPRKCPRRSSLRQEAWSWIRRETCTVPHRSGEYRRNQVGNGVQNRHCRKRDSTIPFQ